jgi:hypothetical protein
MKHALKLLTLTLVTWHLSLPTSSVAATPIGDLEVQRTLKLGTLAVGTITPTQLAANTNDWAPTGFSAALSIRVSTDASRNLTGIAGGGVGRTIILENVGSNSLVLKNADTGSTAANRFAFTRDYTLEAGSGVWLKYDVTSSRWRIAGNQPAPGSSATVTNTGGNLTSNYLVIGAGTVDTKVAAGLTTDGTSKLILGVAGASVGSIDFKNATSGNVNISPPTGALGTIDLKTPAASGTLATTDDANVSANVATHNSQSGNYTLVLTDRFKTLLMTSGSANALTVPPNSSVAFPIGTRIPGWTTGAGDTTITPGAGVTLNSRDGALISAGQHAAWMIEKTATDTWEVTGDLVP